ncbi:MAG: Ig-like domain-containing protein [Saprospiraceae bacterium]|nr:Ig-like domain-containing protein [Saprospiraceae bacterium]
MEHGRSNTSVASVNNAGLVTGLAAGSTRFVFTNTSTGCSSDSSAVLLVNGNPNISFIGPGNICIGQSSQLSPTVGGTWLSLQPTIATVSNTGLVTGISSGTASFVFTEASSGCQATLNNAITVLSRPLVNVTGPNPICIGGNTTLTPTVGGTWSSTNPAVAIVNAGGIVTGISSGISTFIFTNTTGCSSLPSAPVTVSGRPNTLLQGSPTICIGNTTQFSPTTGGTWTSSNPLVATINNQGLVTGVALGTATFTFTDLSTGCISDPSSPVTVQSPAVLEITGPNVICLGYTTTLSASSSGIWYSTHPSVASVSSIGVVTGKAPGKVSFYFEETGSGCISYLPADAISVVNCIDPDFNATLVNITLNGNLKTNDEIPNGSTYLNNPFLVSKPLGSAASLEINPSGSYTFTASMEGVYEYNIQVCLPGMISNCPVSNLVITVVNSYIEKQNIIPNLDIISTFENTAITIKSIYNDKCVAEDECLSDPSRMNIISQPKNGTATLLPNGDITYTPNNNFVGQDTLEYRLCSSIDPANCRLAKQIITVMAGNAINTLVATDDFYAIMKGSILTNANIIINDFDPEDTHFSILPQGSLSNPIMISSGSYYITSAGGLFFTPNPRFIGPVDIVYTICDNQNFCISATVHILVVDHMLIRSRVYLEGALLENGDARSSTSRPLMRDNLRVSPYTGLNYIPVRDPYSFASSFSDISTNYTHERAGLMPQYQTIQDSAAVFGVTGENAIVDWVFMELRDKNDYTRLLATRSALVQRDGDVVDLDGVNPVEFPGTKVDSCYIVLRHRNHFGVMSLKVATIDLTDFTLPTTPTFDYGTSLNNGYNYANLAQKSDVILDYLALWAGDFDGNGKIKFVNPDDDQNVLFIEVLTYPTNTEYTANYNYAYGYLQGDYNLNAKSKYDNPDDDKNMLFYQTLFHPLNTNYISNFNFIIQQVPAVQSR